MNLIPNPCEFGRDSLCDGYGRDCYDRKGRFHVHARARWGDVDAAQIVCYGAFIRFFDLAETEMFRAAGVPLKATHAKHGIWFVRRRVECEYLEPVRLDDHIIIEAAVGHIGNTSLTLMFQVRRVHNGYLSETVCAKAKYVVVAVHESDYRPRPVPESIRQALKPFMHSGD